MDAQWRCGRSAVAALRESGVVRSGDDSSSASRRAKQNDASAPPCPARPSRACLASRTNHVPAVTRVGGRGDGAAVDDGPLCRRRADAAAPSSRGRDLGGRGPMRRVLRQADGGRAQTSLSWLADTLLSQDRAAPIRFCRPTMSGLLPLALSSSAAASAAGAVSASNGVTGLARLPEFQSTQKAALLVGGRLASMRGIESADPSRGPLVDRSLLTSAGTSA